jgi:transcriptional accessory protein Tex/SPT6
MNVKKDVKTGMILNGIVITNFGCFVDLGIKEWFGTHLNSKQDL